MPPMHPSSPKARDRSGYLSEDTIAAITTAVGGAVAMVRISGPGAFEALRALAPGHPAGEPRKLLRARLTDPLHGGEPLDDALVARFVAPGSFTGEDVVELHIHGGSYLAARLLEILHGLGARQALPGEFSFRAVRNGKMTLSQARAVADLIKASNDDALCLALEKLSGTQNRLIAGLSRDLRRLAALGEVGIDFADQDVDEVSLPSLRARVDSLLAALEKLRASHARGARIQEGIRVALLGLPNAGKSSFFNALLGEDRSIVTDLPGTTRDVIREKLTLRGSRSTITLRLEDTAGLRATDQHAERIGIERSRKAAREAELILLVADVTSGTGEILEQWKEAGGDASKTIGILAKRDLASDERILAFREATRPLGISRWIETSAVTGAGIADAVDAITEHCGALVFRPKGEVVLTHLDQLDAVVQAIEHLQRARTAPEIDLFASDIRQVLFSLAPLIGETLPDDILGQIFSEFCIGK